MASPQTENGFTKLANELLDQLCRLHLSGNEWCFVHALIRKTYGYNKKEDWITNSQIANVTGMHRVRVSEAKSKLLEKGIVVEKSNKISLVKDYEKWKVVTEKRNTVTEKRNKVLRKSVPTKERKTSINTISDKSPIMPFNKNKEEAVVDYDSGEIVEPVKPQTKKYPNAPAICKIFQEVLGKNPGNWRVNKTQLLACENLYTERTPAKVRSALLYYQANREEKYCPQISSPYDLDSKWTKLGEFKQKQV